MEPSYKISFWFRKLLVPVDGSELSVKALELALDFNMRYGSEVVVLNVCSACTEEEVKGVIEKKLKRKLPFNVKVRRPSYDSSVANEILQEINEGSYDAVIMGARGLTSNPDIVTGSVALSVVANAPITVILVR